LSICCTVSVCNLAASIMQHIDGLNAVKYCIYFVVRKKYTKRKEITKKCFARNLAESNRLTLSCLSRSVWDTAAATNRNPSRDIIRPFSFFQEGNLILLFARQNSRVAVQDVPVPSIFFYSRCFPRNIICVKTIGWKISESLGLQSQAGIEDASTTHDAHIISSQRRRHKRRKYSKYSELSSF